MRSWFIHSSRTVLLHSKNKQAEYRANFPKKQNKGVPEAVADSLQLPEVVVTGDTAIEKSGPLPITNPIRAPATTLHALQLSDAVKHFSGVTIKDYGGIGD